MSVPPGPPARLSPGGIAMRLVPIWVGAVMFASPAAAADVGFVETYALAADRAAALRQFIPGTEEYY